MGSKGCSSPLYPASTSLYGAFAPVSLHVVMQPMAAGHVSGESVSSHDARRFSG
jgi:hypothetical protein